MLRRILFLSILLCMVIPIFAKKTARALPPIKAEYFITCKQNKCRPCLDYAQLEKLRFKLDEGDYDMYSVGKDKNDLCVQRTGNKVWISYLHILQK